MSIEIPLMRRDEIAARLARGEPVVASALAVEFQVSEDAIRRDLRALAAEGRCTRVYGGALPIQARATAPAAARTETARDRQEALARQAVSTLRDGEFVFLDASRTNEVLAECLPEDRELTVATNSVNIAHTVLRRGGLPLLVVGGVVDAAVGGCIDASAIQIVASMNIDRCFLGACALAPQTGLTASHHGDALFKRALHQASRVRQVLVMNDQLLTQAPHRVTGVNSLDLLIVEHNAPTKALDALREARAVLMQADSAAPRA